jgi:hypothetical protein
MTIAELMVELAILDPSTPVLLTVSDEAGDCWHAGLEIVTLEEDHSSETLFVRLMGDRGEAQE